MNVISKMRVQSVEDYGFSRKVKFTCVHDSDLNIGDNPENRAFTKATPSGEAWMTIDNQRVWPAFSLPGGSGTDEDPYRSESSHYVVFIDAKDHTLADVYRALGSLGER